MESYLQKGKDLTKSIKNKLVHQIIKRKKLINKLPSLNSSIVKEIMQTIKEIIQLIKRIML